MVSQHGSAVVDQTCSKGLPIEWRDKVEPHMLAFHSIAKRLRDLEPLIATVRVTGTVKRAPRSVFIDEPYWYLELTAAEVVKVKREPIIR